jgi:HSP20 family protein
MTSRKRPFEELERLLERMSDVREPNDRDLAVDVEDADDSFVVTADLPGFDKDDIDVEARDRTLHVSAVHEEESETDATDDEETTYIRRERSKQSVSRTITLPEDVDEGAASATFENGILTVELPKSRAREESTSVDVE